MRLKEKISKSFVGVLLAVLTFGLSFTSCDDETTTDHSGFALYYSSLTDISPSMNGTIASPTYKGAAPSNFAITSITYGAENESYTGESFVINAENGAIDIVGSQDLKVGEYKISVSCVANGHTHYIDNAVVVNFMKSVPDGITVEPAELRAEYALVMSDDQSVELPTAKVTTEGNHISISGYQISNIKYGETIIENFPNPLFEISNDGVISIVKGCKRIEIGTYVLSLKLNTAAAGGESELGLFPDAVKINITSKPISLTYEPNSDLLEEETGEDHTSYKGKAPKFVGSSEGLQFSIASVVPAEGKDKFTINPTTGEISVAEGHGFQKDNSYTISVLAKNEFSPEGVLFENVFKLEIVAFIAPIQNFNYAETTVKQALKFNIRKNAAFKGGGNLEFAFTPEDQKKYEGILTLNKETGEISAEKYNKLAVGAYDIHVVATNNKGTEQTVVKLTIKENENYFTYISYGNNINEDQTPGNIYDNQYRFHTDSEMDNKILQVKTDIKDATGIKWTATPKVQMAGTTISDNGTLTLSKEGWKDCQTGYVFVTARKGEGDEAIERTFPVFFNFSKAKDGVTVEYTPFVLHVNPKFGGRSTVPSISNKEGFLMDYRRNLEYHNMNGFRDDGSELESGKTKDSPFLKHVWETSGKSTNYGAKLPMSYYDNSGAKPKTAEDLKNSTVSYVDNASGDNQYSFVVNPEVWYDNGWGDGILTFQLTFVTDNTPKNLSGSSNQIFPLAVWLDKDFE